MKPDEIAEASTVPLLVPCREETRDILLRGAFLQRFPPAVELIREGDPADFVCVLLEGRVELFATGRGRGRDTTLEIAEPTTTLVLAAALTDRVYLQSGRTLEVSRVLMIPAEAVRNAMADDAAFAASVAGEMALRYRELVKNVKELKLRSGAERLANWLLRHARLEGDRGAVMDLPFEKRVLASRLGMSPENLSRAFATVSKYSVVVSGPRIEITDRADLAKLARPDPLIDDRAS